jgi:hypothetical protein
VEVVTPRVNDKRVDQFTGERVRFGPVVLPAWCRKSPKINEVLPLLYLHGLSSVSARSVQPGLPRRWKGSSAAVRACLRPR